MRINLISLLLSLLFAFGCDNNQPTPTDAKLRIRFTYDSSQERLDNLGELSVMPAGHAGLNPEFRKMSAHFIELVPAQLLPYKAGAEVFQGAEVPASNANPFGFTTAIDFDKATLVEDQEIFVEIPLADIKPGTYEHARVSVSYQSFDVKFNLNNIASVGDLTNQTGTLAAFVGYNTFINELEVGLKTLPVNEAKLQGFWAFETQFTGQLEAYNQVSSGQAPPNATTVVNPFPNFPIPQGSCVVSGSFDGPVSITGMEEEDIELTFSFSINKSFEWVDKNANGMWDLDAQDAEKSEGVVDMGLRGLKVFVR
ncbi:MAG: hypothetical protein MRZ79_12920 [Bacteroidia bacterium]|nr:hypothetical protein [Bacteroidia bacterium]